MLEMHKDNGCDYEDAKKTLMSLQGVGRKVADCICLMSLNHLDSVPIDTHIYKIAANNYLPELKKIKTQNVTQTIYNSITGHFRQLWSPCAGWAQAIIFYSLITKKGSKAKDTENEDNSKRKSSTKSNVTRKKCKK